MSKNIVLLSDGTGNSAAKLFRTNVWRLYQALDLKQGDQVAYYDDGVGTSALKPLAILGGALGWGLKRNVKHLYAFLSRVYVPGDKIYAFGFSRGAFTIRILVGMIRSEGLIRCLSEADRARYSAAAYRSYRKQFNTTGGLVGPLRALRDAVLRFWNHLRGQRDYRDVKPNSVTDVEIQFLGLWDTVAAYGLPVDELTHAWDKYVWPLSISDRSLWKNVKKACHALAIDDERNTFHPVLWTEEGADDTSTSTGLDDERISQVWFAGVHSNVGGGYPDDTMAHVPLEWIMGEANKRGLRFQPDEWTRLRAMANPAGHMYDSRHGLAGYYRYKPRRIEVLNHSKRVDIKRTKVHASVVQRIERTTDGYAPYVLPPRFAVVTASGDVTDGVQKLGMSSAQSRLLLERQKRVWNLVWCRRVTYFATVGFSLVLALFPGILGSHQKGACQEPLCFLQPALGAVGGMLPGFTGTWIRSFESNPTMFAFFSFLLATGLFLSGSLAVRIRDEMRKGWRTILPNATASDAPTPAESTGIHRFIGRLITWPPYHAFFEVLNQKVLPAVFLAVVFYAALAFLNDGLFAVRSSAGNVCRGTKNPDEVTTQASATGFRTNSLCWASGLRLEEGVRYRLRLEMAPDDPWTDNGIRTGLNGIDPADVSLVMRLFTPFRRNLNQLWYKPVARIGERGNDTYPLDSMPPQPRVPIAQPDHRPRWINACKDPAPPADSRRDGQPAELVTEIDARTTGELFLYVNDAVIGFWGVDRTLYCNNQGAGTLSVERIRTLPGLGSRPDVTPEGAPE